MKTKTSFILLAVTAVLLQGCTEMAITEKPGQISIVRSDFGMTPDGQMADIYTLTNANGVVAKITNYGGIVTELHLPDRNGNFGDIVLGYKSLDKYIAGSPYFGALIGRYGNRIARGKFTLDGKQYTLATNNGINHLHGGDKGFDKVLWTARGITGSKGPTLELTYTSKDGEEGYPGKLTCKVTYWLTNDNELRIGYGAKTDKPTIINLTHHGYFNLAGHASGNILGHELTIDADYYNPVDEGMIPTGQIKAVSGTPMDFTKPHRIGERIDQIPGDPGGYDHNYVLNNKTGSLAKVATVHDPASGRIMKVYTTEPGLQFYSGNFLDGTNKGKGTTYNKHNGFCLETQHFPDSPNQPDFPSVVLRPGQTYAYLTIYKFSVK